MSRHVHFDFESYSPVDLKKVGAFRYGGDPRTEILMCALAEGDEDPVIWIPEQYETDSLFTSARAYELMDSLADADVVLYAHNAQFESAICRFLFEKQTGFRAPRIEQFRCTAAMCRKASIRPDLEGAAIDLRLRQQKSSEGKDYINIFSKPNAQGVRTMPQDNPEDFAGFVEYCLQDVRTERELAKKLHQFELKDNVLASFQFDARMNQRGIPVNMTGLHNALKIIQHEGGVITQEFRSFVGLKPTQNQKFGMWLRSRGYTGANLQADTITEFLEQVEEGEIEASEEVVRALRLKQDIAYAAASKVAAMINCANDDDYVRGVFLWCGARTGRWSAKYIQPQNFKRPTELDPRETYSEAHPELSKKYIKQLFGPQTSFEAYRMICEGADRDTVAALFGPPLEVISSCIRHFIQRPEGPMFDADYASIEARIVCWLAEQEDMLVKFRRREPIYEDMASYIFGVPASKISKKGLQRFIGKQTVLGCGFGMGPPKFIKSCAKFGYKVPLELAKKAVYGYRDKCSKVKDLWYATEGAAKRAILRPNTMQKAGKIRFFSCTTAGMKYLIMKLPSDRLIAYPDPRIDDEGKITFYGLIKGKVWGRIGTYGGKLVENATQGVAADIMSHGAINAERHGYDIFALIHDEALAHIKPGQTIEEFCRLLTVLPAWAAGLPIEAEGEVIPFYTK